MTLEIDEQILFQTIKEQLGGKPSLQEVVSTIGSLAIQFGWDDSVCDRLVQRFKIELGSGVDDAQPPRLLVDWGELPRVGHTCRPEFSLICPAYVGCPEVQVVVDRELDPDAEILHIRPQNIAPSLWTFYLPFSMSTRGIDCRPGQYLIELQLAFRDVPLALPRFFRCQIRLMVRPSSEGDASVLEIFGDGQSVVNLQGYDLRQFSKVVLKGGQDGVINLANSYDPPPVELPAIQEKVTTTFEYQLRIDRQRQDRLPKVRITGKPRAFLDTASFIFEGRRRTLVYAKPKMTFGRNRDNDVVTRFLPSCPENDRHSGCISRTHLITELTSEGIDIQDESRTGIEINYSIVQKRFVIPPDFVGETMHLDLGVTGVVPRKFEMEMQLFGPDRYDNREESAFWDEVICEIVGGRLSRVGRLALHTGIDAVRYDRVASLAGDESYVHLLREVLVGGSQGKCAIPLRNACSNAIARIMHIDRSFWLEALASNASVRVDGVALDNWTMTPLSPGMEILFGDEKVRFDRPTQLGLDEPIV
jgi:hypothetical protein